MLPSYYEFYNPVKIIAGRNAVDNLPYELEQLGVRRPIVITDKGVTGAGLVEVVKTAFADSNLVIGALFDDVPPDSSIDVVNRIAAIYRENSCDAIVAVGGGSPIDTAKGVNIVVTEEADDLMQFMGAEVLGKPMRPLVVIPTTAGTGSEVTAAAVIADPVKGVKMAFTSVHLLPKVAILDPRMTMTMPPRITAATAMDALTHAMEGYICLQHNPMSDAYAFGAIQLIRDYLLPVVKNGTKDDKARLAMMNAATMAGAAFSNSMVGMVHALGHATGGVAHVPHGVAMSIFLPHGLEYNMKKAHDRIAELLLPLGGGDEFAGTPATRRAERTVQLVRRMQQNLKDLCGLPMTLKEAGVTRDQLDAIARAAINDGALMFNPEEMDCQDALGILKKAYE